MPKFYIGLRPSKNVGLSNALKLLRVVVDTTWRADSKTVQIGLLYTCIGVQSAPNRYYRSYII